jgi:hypothetical protein
VLIAVLTAVLIAVLTDVLIAVLTAVLVAVLIAGTDVHIVSFGLSQKLHQMHHWLWGQR